MYGLGRDGLASNFTPAGEGENGMTAVSTIEFNSLLERASAAAAQSYSPYSGFKVGAALLLCDGCVVTGTNVENVSYGLTICAERSALVRAISEFGHDIQIVAVAVANLNGAASPRCGACRQMLAEFSKPETTIVFPAAAGTTTMRFDEVLPFGFDMKLK